VKQAAEQRLRENPRQNKAFLALRRRFFTKIAVQNVEKACILRRSQPYRAAFRINGAIMANQMSKSQLIEKIATSTELAKRDVKNVMDCLVDVGHKELKKSGLFLVPGFAKFVVIKKPATKARKGTNPFTGEEMMFKAKPARKIVRARPVKAAKDAVA
jgi:DNA-binding protein HU-beta